MGWGLAESNLDLERKMTKLNFLEWGVGGVGRIRFGLGKENEKLEIFFGGGLAESDLDLERKMKNLKFFVGGEVGRIRFGLGKENEKVEIWGGQGWQNQICLGE